MVDSYNEALMKGCRETMGDLPRFMTTAFVARDMEEIRKALKVEVVDMMGISVSRGRGGPFGRVQRGLLTVFLPLNVIVRHWNLSK